MGRELKGVGPMTPGEAPSGEAPLAKSGPVERLAQHYQRLVELTFELSKAVSLEQAAEVIAARGQHACGARMTGLWRLETGGTRVVLLHTEGYPDHIADRFQQLPVEDWVPLGHALRTGEPVWVESRGEYASRYPRSEAASRDLPELHEIGFACLPLVVDGRSIGGLTLLFEAPHSFDDDERQFLLALAQHCAQVFDRASQFERVNQLREWQTWFLSVTGTLGAASDDREVVDIVVAASTETLKAANGALWFFDAAAGVARMVSQVRYTDGMVAALAEVSMSERSPLVAALRTRRPQWCERRAQYIAEYPELAARTALVADAPMQAFACLPLVSGDRLLGALDLAFSENRTFGEEERGFLITLTQQCADIIDKKRAEAALRASEAEHRRLLAAEHRSNDRLSLLVRVGEALFGSMDVRESLAALARLMAPAFADWSSVYLLSGDELQAVAVEHADPGRVKLALEMSSRYPSRLGDRDGVGAILASGKTHWLAELSDEMLRAGTRDAGHFELLRGLGLRSLIVVPIFADGHPMGVALFVTAESGRTYDESDRDFAEEVARRAGVAMDRARLYTSTREAAQRAEEANRIKDEFLATVSHELRTPLNAITGWSTLLLQRGGDAAAMAKGLEVIHRNALAQAKLIEDILDVSRIITGRLKIDPKPVDMIAIVWDALDVVRPSADAKHVALTLVTSQPACLLVGDADRLQQVVWNLLSNAVKFTESGGRISVTVEQEGATVVVAVSDTGKGMEAELLPHVFERFLQADSSTTRRFGGLGLGLAIVRHIVELHGGRAVAESPGPGQGSVFRILLPVRAVAPAPGPEEQMSSGRPTDPRPAGGEIAGIRILVIDDEPDARELLQALLAEDGGVVETAASSREGLEAVVRFRPDVIVSDIGMPEEDGYTFVGRLRAGPAESGAATPAIALTAYTRREDRRRALVAGFNTHVSKPVNARELLSVIASLYAASKTSQG